jgi:predicted O-methyltransferase YrrM
MNAQELISKDPKFYQNGTGKLQSYRASNDVLYFLEEHAKKDLHTLETGAGVSTVLFALKSTHHICIVPDEAQCNNIRQFCREHDISTKKINFIIETSDSTLPRLETDGLDLVFIDGCHGFPIPFIDFHYTASKLNIGGILIIDDIQIWTGHILKNYLLSDPDWETIRIFKYAAIFRKMNKYVTKEWCNQLYVVRNSFEVSERFLKQHKLI